MINYNKYKEFVMENISDVDIFNHCKEGLIAEVGEIFGEQKKRFYKKASCSEELKLEIGDVLFYLVGYSAVDAGELHYTKGDWIEDDWAVEYSKMTAWDSHKYDLVVSMLPLFSCPKEHPSKKLYEAQMLKAIKRVARANGFSLQDIVEGNINKLKKRNECTTK
tara:strand:+ start:430 stop:921 length:492 start_codon:yes stop_codon:yes gene_type:complete